MTDENIKPRTFYFFDPKQFRKVSARWINSATTGESFLESTETDGYGTVIAHSFTPEKDVFKS